MEQMLQLWWMFQIHTLKLSKACTNKAINSDAKKLRCASLFRAGYGKR